MCGCDVCKKETEVHTAACGFGAMSLGYCMECIRSGAEPEWGFEYLYGDVGNKGEGLAARVSDFKTWKDGKYWTWDEWVTWRRLPEQKHLDEEHDRQMAKMDAQAGLDREDPEPLPDFDTEDDN